MSSFFPGDNHLNTKELQRAFSLMNFDLSESDTRILFNYLDKNGDKYVNYSEFLSWIDEPNYAKVSPGIAPADSSFCFLLDQLARAIALLGVDIMLCCCCAPPRFLLLRCLTYFSGLQSFPGSSHQELTAL
jgi:hypothetical protein